MEITFNVNLRVAESDFAGRAEGVSAEALNVKTRAAVGIVYGPAAEPGFQKKGRAK